MSIEWYPGHMVEARKKIAETMRKTDVVIEVLDARAPQSSRNPSVEALRRQNQRPALKILNKSDLADPERTGRWLAYYNAQSGVRALALCAKKPGEVARIPKECHALAPGRGHGAKPLRLMILGIPNVGKSTLMNTLLRRHVAKVADEPAITKMQSRHELSPGVWIVDTPGLLWPGVSPDKALKLAAINCIGRNAYDDENAAVDLGTYLLADYPQLLARRFGVIPEGCDAHGLIDWIARSRSLVVTGGLPDIQKASSMLLNEFRSGALGRITLETVE
jgi:ribosome biogenesis GTPase A